MINPEQLPFPELQSDTEGRCLKRGRNGSLTLTENTVDKYVGRVYVDPQGYLTYHKHEENEHIFRKYNAWTAMWSIAARVDKIIYETADTVYELATWNLMNCEVWKDKNGGELGDKFIIPLSLWIKTPKEGKMKRRLELFGIEWYRLLQPVIESTPFFELGKKIADLREKKPVFPHKDNVFRAFSLPPSGIKVVILGSEPYYNGFADGYAFSSRDENYVPDSLKNIFKEIEDDTGILILDRNSNLQRWVDQGIFLFNTCLTVEAGSPRSHEHLGWDILTTEVIKALDNSPNPMVFILWGNNARDFKKYLTNPDHLILESAHPSPLSASKGFFGSKCFSKTNEYLTQHKLKPIDWR